ncbi:MAG: LysR family transcriptional regulator [Microbacteriaceae bacterium]|nr:LysR family transcriptional regulator [Microbacteriaceae bacterium]
MPNDPFTIAFVAGVTLTRWTSAWEERRPEHPLAFIATTDDDQLEAVRDSRAHVGFVRLPVEAEGMSLIPLYSEAPVVVVPKDHPIADAATVTLAELESEDLVDPHLSPADAVELVAAGGGIVILPQSLARMHTRKDVVARPVTDAAETRIAIVWLAERTTPELEEFVGIVRGRTANSSRAPVPEEPKKAPVAQQKKRPAPVVKKKKFPNKKGR